MPQYPQHMQVQKLVLVNASHPFIPSTYCLEAFPMDASGLKKV